MLESKLVKMYVSLNNEEIRMLNKLMVSPIANVHDDVRKLIAFISSRRSISGITLQKNRAFSYLYPKAKVYNDLRLRHIMSLCTQTMEDFLAYSFFIKNRNEQQLALAKNLQQHQLVEQAQVVFTKIKNTHQHQAKQDALYYLETLQLEIEQFKILSQNSREKIFNLQQISDAIHHYSAAEILKYACISITHQNVSNQQYSFSFLPFIIEQIETQKLALTPAIEIYFYAYKTLTNTNDNSFFKCCVDAVYKHESCFTEHKKYLLDNNELSRFTFTNVVFIGLKLQDFIGVENFIKAYGVYLNETTKENTISFNKARLYFTQKNYKKTMPILLSIEYSDTLWNLASKFMLVKIYFETKEYEALVGLLNTFKVYLFRQKKIGYHKERYKNIIKFSEKLYATIDVSKTKKLKLKNEIEQVADLPDKDWFLEMLCL